MKKNSNIFLYPKLRVIFIHSSYLWRNWEDRTGNVYQALHENELLLNVLVITDVTVVH